MFTRFVHTLTLFAFAAHAAFGCCGHHQHHHEAVDCCHHDDLVYNNGCGEVAVVCSGHDCHHESHDEVSLPPSELTSEMIDGLTEAGFDSGESENQPCNHSHRCNETRCTFVASAAKVIVLKSDTCLAIDSISDSSDCKPNHVSLVSRTWFLSDCATFVSAVDRCARLQSWQI